jgi:hypothetical protein
MVPPYSWSKNMPSMKPGWSRQEADLWLLPVPSKRRMNFQRTTQRYIPDDRTLHNHRCENLSSHKSTLKISDLHCDECPQYGLPDCDTVLLCRCIPSFRGMCCFKVDPKDGVSVCLRNIVFYYKTTRCHNAEDHNLNSVLSSVHALSIHQFLNPINKYCSLYDITASFINRLSYA